MIDSNASQVSFPQVVGDDVGEDVTGFLVGPGDSLDGFLVGIRLGTGVGPAYGCFVGTGVGLADGFLVALELGEGEGSGVGVIANETMS